MDTKKRSNLVGGLLLILIGGVFLVAQLSPDLFYWLDAEQSWPLIVIGVGVVMLFFALFTGVPVLAVPACIVGGIGGILYWQNATGNWGSWAYAWTLIPGFVGVGVILSGLLSGQLRKGFLEGGKTVMVSLVLFSIFGFFFARNDFQGILWPSLLIGVGVIVLLRQLLGAR
jgi:hypothetical protein